MSAAVAEPRFRLRLVVQLCLALTVAALGARAGAQVNVVVRIVNQANVEIPGSHFYVAGTGPAHATGTSVSLPLGSQSFVLQPGVPGFPFAPLDRTDSTTVTSSTTEIRFPWITSRVRLRLQDQHGVDLPESSISIGYPNFHLNGTQLDLPITDRSEYPTIGGAWADGYHVEMIAGIVNSRPHSVASQLGRVEDHVKVLATTTEMAFEWITAQVRLRLHDQNGVDIPNSSLSIGYPNYFPVGTVIPLPITDRSIYPTIGGVWADGYHVEMTVGIINSELHAVASQLARVEDHAMVLATTTELSFEWITAQVRLRLHDQNGVDIPNSSLSIGYPNYFPVGTVIPLPITDRSVYPTIGGVWADGYHVEMTVGIVNSELHAVASQLARVEEHAMVLATTTELSFEWLTAQVRLRLHDQNGVDIPGSTLSIGYPNYFPTGTVIPLPITDRAVYPTISGTWADGYQLYLNPSIGNGGGGLDRIEAHAPVLASTSQLAFEWIVIDCPLRVVDANGAVVPGSSLLLPPVFPPFTIGNHVLLPVTENAAYPTVEGVFANGYPIRVTPGNIAPTSATFEFEVLANGSLQPGSFVIDGNTYSLVRQANRPPVPNAGPNRTISSSAQATTTIAGTGSDPDSDPLTYRWLEGTSVLRSSTPVGTGGAAPLNLGTLPPLASGNHTMTLEVSDGLVQSTSTMVLTISNAPPTATCSGAGTYQLGVDSLVLGGTVADYDGETLSWTWSNGASVVASGMIGTTAGGAPINLPNVTLTTGMGPTNLGPGSYIFTLTVKDGANPPVVCPAALQVVDTLAPRLMPTANRTILWPPNHQMVDIAIQANASDASSGPVLLSASVTSSEDPQKDGSGHTIPDWTEPVINQATGQILLQLRAERSGNGPGRTYTVTIRATDSANNTSMAIVSVRAPHDQGG